MVPVVTPLASCKVVDIFGVPEDKFALCGFYWKFCHREEERTGIWFVCNLCPAMRKCCHIGGKLVIVNLLSVGERLTAGRQLSGIHPKVNIHKFPAEVA